MKRAADIIQDCALPRGAYDQVRYMQQVDHMTPEEFARFFREILQLTEHYDRSINVSFCDRLDFIEEHPKMFYKFRKIDPDAEIHFEMID